MINHFKKILFTLFFLLIIFSGFLLFNINTTSIEEYKLSKIPTDLPRADEIEIISATMGGTYGQFKFKTSVQGNAYDSNGNEIEVHPYNILQYTDNGMSWIYGRTDNPGWSNYHTTGVHTMMVRKDDAKAEKHFHFKETYTKMHVSIDGQTISFPRSGILPGTLESKSKDINHVLNPYVSQSKENSVVVSAYVEPYVEDPIDVYPITDYTLEVIDSGGKKIGDTTQILDSYGDEEIEVTGLLSEHTYHDCQVVARNPVDGKRLTTSARFDLSTLKSISSLSDLSVSDITHNSANITITSNINSSLLSNINEDSKSLPYYLEVQDDQGNRLGGGISSKLETYGEKTISLSGLDAIKKYTNCKVVARKNTETGEISSTSEPFEFETLRQPVGITNLKVDNIEKYTATATVDIIDKPDDGSNGKYKDYVIEVKDQNNNILGKTITSTDGGEQTINLTGLEMGKEYTAKAFAENPDDPTDVYGESNDFTFTAAKGDPVELTTPTVPMLDKETATIETSVSELSQSNFDGEYNDYILEVYDRNDELLGNGKTLTLTSGGIQHIELSGLIPNTTYRDNYIVASDPNDPNKIYSTSDPFKFKTLPQPVGIANLKVNNIEKYTAIATVDIIDKPDSGSNGKYEDYVIEVKDQNNTVLGRTITSTDGGEQTINLTGLEIGKEYTATAFAENPADLTEVYGKSNDFTFTAAKGDPVELTTPTVPTISKATATIETSVSELSQSNFDGEYNDYILEVYDRNDELLGNGKTSTLTSGGFQKIELSGLIPNTTYRDNYVVASDPNDPEKIYSTSEKFSFTTKKKGRIVSSLMNATTTESSYNSVLFSVDVDSGVAPDNQNVIGDLDDYSLCITNGKNVLGTSPTFNTDGTQTFTIINLKASTTYSGYYVEVIGNPEVKSNNIEDFTTTEYPFSVNQNSFEIDRSTITKNGFNFSVSINDPTDEKLFDPEKLVLFNGEKELKITNINEPEPSSTDDDSTTYEYKVSDLKSFKKYHNFYILVSSNGNKLDKVIMYDNDGGIPWLRTKISKVQIYLFSFLLTLALIIAISPIILFMSSNSKRKRDNKKDGEIIFGKEFGDYKQKNKKQKKVKKARKDSNYSKNDGDFHGGFDL